MDGHDNNACIRWLFSGIEGTQASCSIFIPYPHIYPSNMPTTLPIMCFKLHRKHGDTWNSDRHSLVLSCARHTRFRVTTVNCSQTLFPWDYEARAAQHRMLSEHAVLQCELQAAEARNGKLWRVSPPPISLITQSHHMPSPLSSWCSLSFTRRKCICLRFLWICKIKTSWREDAAQPLPALDAQSCPSFELFKQTEEF